MAKFARLTRLQRITLILFVAVVTNWVLTSTTGYALIGADLINAFFILALLLLGLNSIRPAIRRLVWRLRNRLLVTYFLVGVVPIILIVTMISLALIVLMGQTTSYLVQNELDRRVDLVEAAAHDLAVAISSSMRTEPPQRAAAAFLEDVRKRMPRLSALVRTGTTEFSVGEDKPSIVWIEGSRGLWRTEAEEYLLAAQAETGVAGRRVAVIAFEPMDADLLARLLSGLATVEIVDTDINSAQISPLPQARGFWDARVGWMSPLAVQSSQGRSSIILVDVGSRPSLIVSRLFSTLGAFARAIGLLFLVIAGVFMAVEIASLIWTVQLTRSITRTVHDLYTGTQRVESGDFTHRIPIRTRDQLSELARSFNSMTEHIELLIREVRDKEKLESELEIAREVQSQLFPKGTPKLRTLELAGVCKPGRVVSGDYYDFVALDSQWTVLAVGDVAGKGISAALLMASIQSALHTQLPSSISDGGLSTAALVRRINKQLYENTSPEKYATFYCAVYDDTSGRLVYTNAGHLPPILIRNGKSSRLEVNGMVVGILPDAPFEQDVIELQPGDLLAAFTDGVTESENASGEQFGEERLTELLLVNRSKPLEEIVQIVTDSVRDWAYDPENQDDTTVLLARRL